MEPEEADAFVRRPATGFEPPRPCIARISTYVQQETPASSRSCAAI